MLSSDVFLIVIFPLSASTLSLKFKTMLASSSTSFASSAGVEDERVGLALSTEVKLNAVVELIPA